MQFEDEAGLQSGYRNGSLRADGPKLALPLGRPKWVPAVEQHLQHLVQAGHSQPVEELVAALSEQWQAPLAEVFAELERHVDLMSFLRPRGAGMSTPVVRTVGQTPKASLAAAWPSPSASPTAASMPSPSAASRNIAASMPSPSAASRRTSGTAFFQQPNASPFSESSAQQQQRPRSYTEGYAPKTASPHASLREYTAAAVSPAFPIAVGVIAPGAGTGINGAVYSELGRDPNFKVEVVGQSRAPYDVYPPSWPHGYPALNLETFADKVLDMKVAEQVDCLVFGSRGGQVVLPYMWQAQVQGLAPAVPPAVVINGGCAMNLPSQTCWPDAAITFVLIGGQDNFRGNFGVDEYIAETRSHVPRANRTTAVLYVDEMTHMPQQHLLRVILKPMLQGLQAWKGGQLPLEQFRTILSRLSKDGWTGRLLYTSPAGWEDIKFSAYDVGRFEVPMPVPLTPTEEQQAPPPVEFTRSDELKALWKAAARVATGSGAPNAPGRGNRFAGVVKAATSGAHCHSGNVAALEGSSAGGGRPPTLPSGPKGSEFLQLPVRSGLGLASQEQTPIARALGMPARPRSISTSVSANSSPLASGSPHGGFFAPFSSGEPSPSRRLTVK